MRLATWNINSVRARLPLLAQLAAEEAPDVICLQETNRMRFARVGGIRFVRAADDYTEVHLDDGSTALVGQRLRRWSERLPQDTFVQVHRSTIVNLTQVAQVTSDGGRWRIELRGGDVELPLSRRYAQALRQRLEWVV